LALLGTEDLEKFEKLENENKLLKLEFENKFLKLENENKSLKAKLEVKNKPEEATGSDHSISSVFARKCIHTYIHTLLVRFDIDSLLA